MLSSTVVMAGPSPRRAQRPLAVDEEQARDRRALLNEIGQRIAVEHGVEGRGGLARKAPCRRHTRAMVQWRVVVEAAHSAGVEADFGAAHHFADDQRVGVATQRQPATLPRTVATQPCWARKCTTLVRWFSDTSKARAISAIVQADRSARAGCSR